MTRGDTAAGQGMTHEPPPGLHADADNDHVDDPSNEATDTRQAAMDKQCTNDTGGTHRENMAANTMTPAGTVAPTGLGGGGGISYVTRATTIKAEPANSTTQGAAKSQVTITHLEWKRTMHPDEVGRFVQDATQMAGFIEAKQKPVDDGIQVKVKLCATHDTITKNFDDLYDKQIRKDTGVRLAQAAHDTDTDAPRSDTRSEPRRKCPRTSGRDNRRDERSPPPPRAQPLAGTNSGI